MSALAIVDENGKLLCTCHTELAALDIAAALKAAGRDVQVCTTEVVIQWPEGWVPFQKGNSSST